MKSLVLVFCAVQFCACLHAQTKGYDRFSTSPPGDYDTITINALINRSVSIYLQNPDSARNMAEKALILSKELNYHNGIGQSFAAIGYTYWAQSYFAFSLYYLFNAIDYLKTGKQYGELSQCYRIIARNYSEVEQYNLAQSYLHESEVNAALSKDNSKIALIYNESSLIDLRQKNYNRAWQKGATALQLAYKYSDTLLTGIIYSRLADILKETGKDYLSKTYFDSAYRWSILDNNNRLRSILLNSYASYYLHLNNIDKALAMAQAASTLADSTGNMTVKLTAAAIVAECYRAKKDVNQELVYQVKYNSLQDSINVVYKKKGFQLFQQFFTLNSRLHDLEVQEHTNLISKERLRFQHITIIALIMFIVILLAGLVTIYYLYKEKERLFQQLADRNTAVIQQKDIIEEQSRHLAQLNDLKTKLFAVISHDLRTPVSSLRSIMSLFQKEGLTEEQTVALLKRMLPALDAADLTLSNLLNWSVKQMSGLKISRSTVQLYGLAAEMERVFEFALVQKNISLVNNIPVDIKASFDEQHLTIILRNLVSNAIKFTPPNGTITIAAKKDHKRVIIAVQDTGQGISEENISKLFTANNYFTTHGTQGEKGTGLGLMLCRELLELNNATIFVESAQGKGSTFYINMPEKGGG